MSRTLDTFLRPGLLAAAIALSAPLASTSLMAAEQTTARTYNLPAGSLSTTLNQIASQSGITLAIDPTLVAGKTSAPVSGTFEGSTALREALRGTGLQLQQSGGGAYGLVPVPVVEGALTLGDVNVNASAVAEGSEAAGYVSENISNVGALGSMKLQDTPYSMSVTSQALLKNMQATSLDDVFKRNPFTQMFSPTGAGYASAVNIRGFSGAGNLNIANDGLRFSTLADAGNFLEETEQLEVITGLTGFLYGPATPGGLANYVLKRPTYETYRSVTLGNAGGDNYYLHGDFGGKIDDEGKFAYRLNLLTQDGQTAIDMQKRRRELISLAVDWNVSDDLQIQFDASHKKTEIHGLTSYWYFGDQALRPRASQLHNDKLYSQKWSFSDNETDKGGVRAKWRLNDTFTLRGAFATQKFTEENTYTGPTVYSPGVYTQPLYAFAPIEHQENSAYLFLDAAFDTGAIGHKMTMGYQGNDSRIKQYEDHIPSDGSQYADVGGGALPFGSSEQVTKPGYSIGHGSKHLASTSQANNFLIGDVITFNDQWSSIVGVTRTQIKSYANDFIYSSPAKKTRYDASKTSPSVSLIYKPVPWLTTYATYIEGLQAGGTAPYNAINAGEIFAPQVSKQYEVGAKATVGDALLTLALFNIEKPNGYLDGDMVYTESGKQVNNGLEFSVTGKVTPELTVIGGFTLLDPKVKDADNKANDGNAPVDVAKQLAKLYAEYDINAVPGLALTGGAFYTGKQYTDVSNDYQLPSFTTFDAGARYRMKVSQNDLTLRMNVSNLANKDYWLNSHYLGDPRTVQFSAQLEF